MSLLLSFLVYPLLLLAVLVVMNRLSRLYLAYQRRRQRLWLENIHRCERLTEDAMRAVGMPVRGTTVVVCLYGRRRGDRQMPCRVPGAL